MTGRRTVALLGRLAALAVLAGCWLAVFAAPAVADNCDVRINPSDCQNTAWTVGSVAAVAAAATAVAVAVSSTSGGAEGGEAEGAAAAGGEPEPPPGPPTEILSGPHALEVLQEMGLVVAKPQPDGTVKYFPTSRFEELNSGNAVSYEETGKVIDPTTGKVVQVQEQTITRVGGLAWNPGPDGSIGDPVLVVEHTPPGGWQQVNELAPGVRAQGDPQFVQDATNAYNQLTTTAAGQQIINDISATGQPVRIRHETDPTAGNSYGATRRADRFQNNDGTTGLGTGGNVWFDPSRVRTGDGSQPWHTRPPAVGLGHELAHARDAAQGNQATGTMNDPMAPAHPANPDNWVINNREAQATSIGPYAGNPSDENAIRSQLGQPNRGSYVR
jgi:hypothetical protein